MMPAWATTVACSLALLVGACSSGGGAVPTDGGSGGAGGAPGNDGPPGDPNAVLGSFLVNLVAAVPAMDGVDAVAAHTTILGAVTDGATPELVNWEDSDSGAGCTLQVPHIPFCDPACTGGLVCVGGGTCVGYPTPQDVGTVTITGIGADAISIKPLVTPGSRSVSYQPAADVVLPYPPAAEGAPIKLDAPGGKLGAFSIQSTGIAPLAFAGPVPLETGKPLALTWTAPAMPSLTRIKVRLDISHHGGTRGQILCDVPDEGALTVPAALITKLVALGVAGFPGITLSRVATGWAILATGRISLEVNASVQQHVQIPGLVDCTESSDCPAGMTCQADLLCK